VKSDRPIFVLLLLLSLSAFVACDDEEETAPEFEKLGRCQNFDALKKPLFGDTHVHTSLSLDANLQATRMTPRDAYAFAKGEAVGIQPYDAAGKALRTIKIGRPLDFVMLSDHAEFFGTISVCTDPNYAGYTSEDCKTFREDPALAFIALNSKTAYDIGYPDLCGTRGFECQKAGDEVWKQIQRDADTVYDKSSACTFSSFVGYEWTSNPRAQNLHRNIMFRNHVVPTTATSVFEAENAEELWTRLKKDCLDANNGCDVLTIPHNSNLSNGLMFLENKADGSPFDAAYVKIRNEMEPLFEVFQHKGDSECSLAASSADEYCQFEKLPWNNLASANLGGADLNRFTDVPEKDFVRSALGVGMMHEETLGTNPFQYGMIGATDTHIGAPGAVAEKGFAGHGGAGQPNREASATSGTDVIDGLRDVAFFNPGGLAGVWAEENSREAIFQAMRRRETFGTSGPRIVVRFFGAWDFPDNLCRQADRITTAYAQGVPMGGRLPKSPSPGSKPVFFVAAQQDTGVSSEDLMPLKEVQIIKGWVDTATIPSFRTKVFHVSGHKESTATVDLKTCAAEANGSGSVELCGLWTDEEFRPEQRAFYYVRVLENPSCRWTTRQCVLGEYECNTPNRKIDQQCCDPVLGLNREMCTNIDCGNLDSLSTEEKRCCDPSVQPIIHERAWTSPIWTSP
jgi:hypothetical protein